MNRRVSISYKEGSRLARCGIALAALGLMALAVDIKAHGIGTPQVLNVAAGPYLLSAWTDPDPLRENETHVVVAVTDPQTREPIVSGVQVAVSMTSLENPTVSLTESATTDSVNRLLYAVEFNDQVTAGRWRAGLNVTGERGAGDEVSFEIQVEPARPINWLWIGVGGMAALVLLWLAVSMRETTPRARRRGAVKKPYPPAPKLPPMTGIGCNNFQPFHRPNVVAPNSSIKE